MPWPIIVMYVDIIVGTENREEKKMISRAPAEMAVIRENKVLRAYGPAEKGSYD